MKQLNILTLFALLFFGLTAMNTSYAQEVKFRGPDSSPLDMSYLKHKGEAPVARVIYSRPQQKDREIFGNLVPYDQVWRTGANEATEITFFKDVVIEGKKVKKGSYSLFTIPGKDKWTIILSKELHVWGAYTYKEANDALRVEVKAETTESPVEYFSMTFAEKDETAYLVFAWENTMVKVPFTY
ncbi:DUF2911 domain-containing protein [Algivirga pacifica]|uniref:DUF2911 domain-containing protein n=1 Tax=Algivirga pacifica TaxID=1162670 RepID=A0ABP9DFW7_9BACT